MPDPRSAVEPALPAGAVLLHIGPHKTGTTSLQDAAAHRRAELAAAGVVYPGKTAHHSTAARAVGGRSWGWQDRGDALPPNPAAWDKVATQVRATSDRAYLSSEFFSELSPEAITRAVTDLGADRVQVVITLRPLARLMPSSWQQHLKGGLTRPFDAWLEAVLADPPNPKVTPVFWRRHDHPALVRRWIDVVGVDRVTVVMANDDDRPALSRSFEQLLDLPAGLLGPAPGVRTNRSMTAAECELVRQVNLEITGHAVGWTNYERMFRNAGVLRMVENRRPEADEAPLTMPAWAVERANAVGAAAAKAIEQTGVRVVGDLTLLSAAPMPSTTSTNSATAVPVAAAADLAIGIVSGAINGGAFLDEKDRRSRVVPPPTTSDPAHAVTDLPVREATTPELVGVLRRRVTGRARRLIKRS